MSALTEGKLHMQSSNNVIYKTIVQAGDRKDEEEGKGMTLKTAERAGKKLGGKKLDNKHSAASSAYPVCLIHLFLPPLLSSSLRWCFCIRVMSQGAARGLMYLHWLISFPNGRHGSMAAHRNWAFGWRRVGGKLNIAGDRPTRAAGKRGVDWSGVFWNSHPNVRWVICSHHVLIKVWLMVWFTAAKWQKQYGQGLVHLLILGAHWFSRWSMLVPVCVSIYAVFDF